MNDIKETKMAIENELEDIVAIKAKVVDQNKFSQSDTQHLEKRVRNIHDQLQVLKSLQKGHEDALNKPWEPMKMQVNKFKRLSKEEEERNLHL